MSPAESFEVVYNFLDGEAYEFSVIPADHLHVAPRTAGLYAWYLRIPQRRESAGLDAFRNIYSSADIGLTGHGTFADSYYGKLSRNAGVASPGRTDAVAVVSAVFSTPIYIGRASDMRRRLLQHQRALEKALLVETDSDSVDTGVTAPEDTNQESRQFAIRVAQLLRKHDIRAVHWLFVKTVSLPGFSNEDLAGLEYFFNRTFYPICGKV